MKVILAIGLVGFVALAYSQADVEVQDEADGPKYPHVRCPSQNAENATLLPNPFNCNTYFACESGEPIPMKCPPGLHFNAELSVCDYPYRANCKERAQVLLEQDQEQEQEVFDA